MTRGRDFHATPEQGEERFTIWQCPSEGCPGRVTIEVEPSACYYNLHPDATHDEPLEMVEVEVIPADRERVRKAALEAVLNRGAELARIVHSDRGRYQPALDRWMQSVKQARAALDAGGEDG